MEPRASNDDQRMSRSKRFEREPFHFFFFFSPSTRLVFFYEICWPPEEERPESVITRSALWALRDAEKEKSEDYSVRPENRKRKREKSAVSLVKNETRWPNTPPSRFSYSQLASFLPRLFEFKARTIAANTRGELALVPLRHAGKKQRGFLANKNASQNPPRVFD